VWHGDKGRPVFESVKWTLETTMDLARAGKRKVPKPPHVKTCWKKPGQNVLKINVDASFREVEMHGSTGLVVRDHEGELILAQALWYPHAASPMAMEALAIRDAVQLAVERGYHMVVFESDAQEVVKLMKESGIGRSEIAGTV
jgi:hypothetical protein